MIKATLEILMAFVILFVETSNKWKGNHIIRIKVTTISPDRIVDNKGVSFFNQFYISYYDRCRIYELPYHKTYEIDNRLIYDSVKYEFFICTADNNLGYLLKEPSDSFSIKIKGDSILNTRAYGGDGLTKGDLFKELKIESTKKVIEDNEKLLYRYTFINQVYDSAYFYYNSYLKDIKFSFSRPLDSTNNSKLNKIELFIKHNGPNTPAQLKAFYINSFEISIAPSENEQELKNLFERFIKQEKLLSLK